MGGSLVVGPRIGCHSPGHPTTFVPRHRRMSQLLLLPFRRLAQRRRRLSFELEPWKSWRASSDRNPKAVASLLDFRLRSGGSFATRLATSLSIGRHWQAVRAPAE